MDCFKSGREGIVGPEGVDAELDGLLVVTDVGPPKKSMPNNDSEAFVCFGGAEALGGGGRPPRVSVVLGLTGRSGPPSNRSIGGPLFGAGGSCWLEDDAVRWDDSFASLAFCCTTLSGCNTIISIGFTRGIARDEPRHHPLHRQGSLGLCSPDPDHPSPIVSIRTLSL